MVMLLWNPLRRLWQAALEAPARAKGARGALGRDASAPAAAPRAARPVMERLAPVAAGTGLRSMPQVAPVVFRSPAQRATRQLPSALRQAAQPLTPFHVPAFSSASAAAARGPRCRSRPFWMTLDPLDRRRAAIGGSFAEVCAALERLAAAEEGLRH